MGKGWQKCDICGADYAGVVVGDCGSTDAKHRAARGQAPEEKDDRKKK